MPRNRKKNEAQPHVIYVLISSISDEFYVGKTTAATPNVAYKFHAAQKHKHTSKLFENSRKAQKFPRMYLLEEINDTPKAAFGHCVAWTKYFVEQGLTPIAYQKVLTYIEELTEENEGHYNRIKDVPLGSVLSDEHLLISDYKAQEKKKTTTDKDPSKERIITLHVSPNNYELLTYKAKEAKMSLSKYCQTEAIHGYVATINVWEYLDALRGFTDVLQKILLAILQHGKYYPADINNVFKLLKMVNDNEKEVVKSLKQQTEKLVGYKKLKLENYRLKKRIKELEGENKAHSGS